MREGLKIQPIRSSCCVEESGRPVDAPVVYNPHTHVCCGGCVSEWKPRTHQFHGLPGQRCRAKVHLPHTEICCDGQRHLRQGNTHCCGVKAYNIKDPQMKCCAGTLHTVPIGREAQCCGSTLQTAPKQNVCCLSEDMEVLYSAKMGFGCCGHLYYNSSLWSCCAGTLSPAPQPGCHRREKVKESILLSLNNLNEEDLCDEMQIGTVDSVSLHGIAFNSVLTIHGRSAIVIPLASPHILQTPDHCSVPKLVLGKSYFFDKVNVFTDSNHDSILQSLHFIISKCYRPLLPPQFNLFLYA
ncbi:galaxin [Cyclopterus lumpus]|uniref:galaxin n=1 Tax=Cyclopterus lumpus TaxID=8103 RepID=UPI0014863682|nr:galaxin [Cyclopterus lumpus]XP_034404649.1 galaxin [Cyclopterus lumpus]